MSLNIEAGQKFQHFLVQSEFPARKEINNIHIEYSTSKYL